MCNLTNLSLKVSIYTAFSFPFLFSWFCCFTVFLVLTLLLFAVVIRLSLLFFLCIPWVLKLLHQRGPQCRQVFFLVLFCVISREYCTSSSISLYFYPLVWVLPLSILRRVQSILKSARLFVLQRDSCHRVWFRSVLLFFCVIVSYPWFNGYRRRKWTRQLKFKSWTRLIVFHKALIPLGKVWIL